jgi:exosortase E/protease (VPEID-CTERM system)
MPPSAAAAFAPLREWLAFARKAGSLGVHAALGAIVAMIGVTLFQSAWKPASRLTFTLVESILRPVYGTSFLAQPELFRIGTNRFAVIISEQCSGLEGIGLLIAFGIVCLVLFRNELRFPHCLALFPLGMTILFLLNAVRIAALIAIGHWGARDIAVGGFHSQAGWIAFNAVAFGLCLLARRWKWIWTHVGTSEQAAAQDPTTAFLSPFLAIIAAGMIVRAMSGAFEWLYGVRVVAAAVLLWRYRKSYVTMNWRPGWPSIAAGLGVFAIWIAIDHLQQIPAAPMPRALAESGGLTRNLWIAIRAIGAIAAIPIAEELAFRAFLLRRFSQGDFQNTSFENAPWIGNAISSIIFGLLHGSRWPAGIIAGFAYAWAAQSRGRFGDAAVAHALTNALIAITVIGWGQWQLW